VPPGYPQQPPQAPRRPDPRPKTIAIIALVAAAVGLVMAVIPFVVWFSGLLLLAGLVLSLIALISRKQGGTGFAIGALATSVAGGLLAVVMGIVTVFSLGGMFAAEDGMSSESSPAPFIEESEEGSGAIGGAVELEVTEIAFAPDEYDPSAWWYVVVLENPSSDHVYDFAPIELDALDADGAVIESRTDYARILPGKIALSGIFFDVGEREVDTVEVRLPGVDEASPVPAEEVGEFVFEDIQATAGTNSTAVRGTVRTTFDVVPESFEITIVARDADGTILGADWNYITEVPADGSPVPFEGRFFQVMPDDAEYEVYAYR